MIRVWTYLKNTDLHAMSAYETLTGVMGISYLRRLRRFQLFEFDLDLDGVMRKLEGGFSVLNPTKEGYFLDRLPTASLRGDEQVFMCRVDSGLVGRAVVWEMVVSEGVARERVGGEIVRGLLANPIYEVAGFLDLVDVFG